MPLHRAYRSLNNLDSFAGRVTFTEVAAEIFFFSRSDRNIPTLWSGARPGASPTRHQGAATARTSNAGGSTATLGVDFSLLRPIQRHTAPSTIKIELFNAQSITNKSCLIHDHILDKCSDLMCLTETWHQPDTGYCYRQKARSTGRGGGLAVIHRSDLGLSLVTLPELSSFKCLAFKCKPPLSTTILLIYRPPKPNSSFIPEMSNLLNILYNICQYHSPWRYKYSC